MLIFPIEKLNMAELLQNTRSDRDRGNSIDLEYVMDEMVNVFKQEDEQEELSLQSAFLASGPSRTFQSQQDAPVRSTTGGAVLVSGGQRQQPLSPQRKNPIFSTWL